MGTGTSTEEVHRSRNRQYCSLSLEKLNEIYEIANEPRGVAVAKKFAPSNTFWDFIANGNFTPGKAYQSQIRNPTLRVIAKIISNLLFAKDQTSKVTNGELKTLYAGIEDEICASGSGIPIQKVKTNPGFHFITMLCEKRLCLMHSTNKKDRSGSLLTPLFKHFDIDLSKYKVNTEIQYLDIKYLMACHIMRDEDTYNFFDKEGTQLFTKLPHPEITRLSVFDNVRFLPPPELLCTDPRAAAPDADMEDVEDITPEADPSYDLGELADVTDDQAYRRWMVDSQRKNNSLMWRILHLVTGGCIGGSNQRQSPAEQTPRSHRPGKAPMGTGTSTEETPPRTKQSATRTRKTNNTPPQRAQQQTSASYPWPREQEDEPINLDDPMLLDFNCERWDKETTSRYNTLLKAEILPTLFCHAETLAELGIDEDVFETLHAMGIAPLCYATHELYPDFVRQVLTPATISYEDFSAPSYANCSFSFMAEGEYCSLSLDKHNEIYEIANEPRGLAVAKKSAPSNTFWDFIANGNFTPGKAYHSQIRNPTLRVIAKIISNLLFAKDQTSKVTNEELQTLYACIEDEIRA
ncbi:hypothetical protein DY000_02058519 [Brassica cretica]|uniref:Arabidopsis retrotransposon Orf1 C-terminal domain-containing protein n=1 Tax=Brassica cretica TaxID=69181 RepID=A0ABQ7AZK7_BRACR|nr:hypothetical protein DY000_02058519 [Brassica cretica]